MFKITKSLAIIALTVMAVAGSTYAAWSSIKASADNEFTAGTMDLQLSKDVNMSSDAAALFTETGLAPGVLTENKTLYFKNVGSVEGKVKLNVSYSEYDTSLPYGNPSANNFARNLQLVSSLTDNAFDASPFWTAQIIRRAYGNDTNAALVDMAIYEVSAGVYAPTMYGLTRTTFYFENSDSDGANPTSWPAGAAHQAAFQFKFSPNAGNEYQGNGIKATLTATMVQFEGGSF